MRLDRVLVAAALTLAAAAAIAQDAPESLLPPGFDEAPPPAAQAPPRPDVSGAIVQPLPTPSVSPSASPSASPSPIDPALAAQYEMPAFARRSLARVGVVGTSEGGLAEDAFGDADGQWLEILMRRTAAPLPSRWLSIALRRALLSRVRTPARVNGADFAAERAWLLLRMGESVAARGVVQAVDVGDATPKLRQIVMQAALATGDPGALCPYAAAFVRPADRGWVMANAMCAGLAGAPGSAPPLIRAARRQRVASGVDLQLAQKVVGAGTDSRQAITIEWGSVTDLTAWRFGLATATGVTIPDELYATAGPQLDGWRALAPAIPPADRAAPAMRAAAMGVVSSAALVDLYGVIAALDEPPASLSAVATDLAAAYVAGDLGERRDALRQLWEGGEGRAERYARLVLTARAAARLPVDPEYDRADRAVAAMLSAGLDRTAMRWRGAVADGGDAWAMLTLADPDFRGRAAYGDVTGYAGSGDATAKRKLLFAGLAGLGRLSPEDIERAAEAMDVRIGATNAWTRAIDRAAARRQPGTVVLLAAIGMQTPDWRGVPPEALYRIVGALRAVGLGADARMIAAEAIARA